MTSNNCLICNVNCATPDALEIFSANDKTTYFEQSLPQLIGKHIGKPLTTETVHSQIVCKKCFKLIYEAEELQQKLLSIKYKISINYTCSERNSNGDEQKFMTDDLDETLEHHGRVVEEFTTQSDVEPAAEEKLFDMKATTSVAETTSVKCAATDDKAVDPLQYSMDDIELELVKIHSGVGVGGGDGIVESAETISADALIDVNAVQQYIAGGSVELNGHDEILQEVHHVKLEESNANAALDGEECSLLATNETSSCITDADNNACNDDNDGAKLVLALPETTLPTVATDVSGVECDQMFACTLCQNGDSMVYGDIRSITNHMKCAHGIRVYFCDVCGQDFRKRNELSAHLDEHMMSEDGDFQCEVCNRIFSNLRLYRIHRRSHNAQNKIYSCKTCDKKFTSRNLLEEHTNAHDGVRPYQCAVCEKRFSSKYTFKAHQKIHEERPRPYACPQCPKTFLNQQNAEAHKHVHVAVKQFVCNVCGKQFCTMHNLEVHSIVHTGRKPFFCNVCNKSFARKAEIRDHERTHTGERPFQCEVCGATFSQRSNLQSHKRATHMNEKRYHCDECDKRFKRRRLLDYHIQAVHTGERPYKCGVCDATFVYPEHFKKHRRIHTGEKPYHCEVCGKAFNSRDNRNAHRFIHSDKKPYECVMCGQGFMRKPQLYQHMKQQNHMNDTIVVNHPRLTAPGDDEECGGGDDDDDAAAAAAFEATAKEIALVDGAAVGSPPLAVTTVPDDAVSLNVATLKSDVQGELKVMDKIEHIIIDAQDIKLDCDTNAAGTATNVAFISSGADSQIVSGRKDHQFQLVRVLIPNENGDEEEAWIKIVPD